MCRTQTLSDENHRTIMGRQRNNQQNINQQNNNQQNNNQQNIRYDNLLSIMNSYISSTNNNQVRQIREQFIESLQTNFGYINENINITNDDITNDINSINNITYENINSYINPGHNINNNTNLINLLRRH